MKVQHLLTDNTTGGKGISSFKVCPFSNQIIIRGTFSVLDLEEIILISKKEKEKHSKFHSESESF